MQRPDPGRHSFVLRFDKADEITTTEKASMPSAAPRAAAALSRLPCALYDKRAVRHERDDNAVFPSSRPATQA